MLDTKKIKTEWDLSPLYKNDTDPKIFKDKKTIENKVNGFVKKWESRNDYLRDSKILRKALVELDGVLNYVPESSIWYYFFLRSNVDSQSDKVKKGYADISNFSRTQVSKVEFFENKLSKIDKSSQTKFLRSPDLKEYKYFLKKTFDHGKFVLNSDVEKVLTLKSGVSSDNWSKMLSDLINEEVRTVKFKGKKKQEYNISALYGFIESEDRATRKLAYENIKSIKDGRSDIAEREINSLLENKEIEDDLRGYTRPDQFRLVAEDFDVDALDALRKAVVSDYKTSRRYYSLKRKIHKLDKLEDWDLRAPISAKQKKIDYKKASQIVYKVLNDLDPEFVVYFEDMLYEGRVDLYPRKGKRLGGFCAYADKSSPFYILMNSTDTLNDVLTLAHEMGHCLNDYYMRVQNNFYWGTPLATAEVASTFFEDFVFAELVKGVDDKERLELYLEKISSDLASIHRQINFYEFEMQLHQSHRENKFLTVKEINDLWLKNSKLYLGSAVNTKNDNAWVSIPHFRYFFYVYSYASGLLISKAMQAKVKEDPKFIEKVKQFLAAGCSDSPKNLFKKMGIDITNPQFWKDGLREIEDQLNEAEKLAKKLGKI